MVSVAAQGSLQRYVVGRSGARDQIDVGVADATREKPVRFNEFQQVVVPQNFGGRQIGPLPQPLRAISD